VDYYQFFLDEPDKMKLLLILGLGMMRFVPIVILAPFFGAKIIPPTAKVAIVLSLAVIFLPMMMQEIRGPLPFDLTYIGLMFKELFIGVLLGTFISIPFFVANASGVMIDHQRGTSSFTQLDPTSGNQASPIGLFYNYMLTVLFFQIGGVWLFLDSVNLSYTVVPPDKFLGATFFASHELPVWQSIIGLGNVVMTIGSQLAAPALVSMFMTDLFLGIANRLAPQVPMSFLGWSLKSLFGIGIIYLGWLFILGQLRGYAYDWLELTRRFTLEMGVS
jgi:type III secretion protein T